MWESKADRMAPPQEGCCAPAALPRVIRACTCTRYSPAWVPTAFSALAGVTTGTIPLVRCTETALGSDQTFQKDDPYGGVPCGRRGTGRGGYPEGSKPEPLSGQTPIHSHGGCYVVLLL
ncbi:hypothetical protein HJFPF1_00556 [Paramyrothecium foliicola]|nr:hypothetical protein HJFPF1_00556 [Paramyrothecium foliicola]